MTPLLLSLLISVSPVKIVSSEMTRCPDATYMDFREGKKVWDYATGLELKAFLDVHTQAACSREVFDYAESWYDAMVGEDGIPFGYKLERYNIDHICPGRTLIPLYKATGKEKYLKALQLLHKQISSQPRTVEGGYWHKGIYPHQIWLDGLYMAEPFLVEYAAAFGTEEQFREACAESMRQFLTAAKVTFDPATGLLRHAYDSSRQMFWCDPVTGQSAHCWARALGWYCMAAVEVLENVPADTPGRNDLVAELRRIISILPHYADKKSGMWCQVLDQPGRKDNYLEASSSAMFTYTILKGVRMGLLDSSLEEYGRQCWDNLLKTFVTFDREGLVNLNHCCTVGGLGGGTMRKGDFAYYISEPVKSNDPKGIGPFIWAALEMERRHAAKSSWPGFEHGMGVGGWLTNYKRFNVLPDNRRMVLTTGDFEHFDTYITKKDVANIASMGMDHIRVGFDQIVLEPQPYEYCERTIRLLDSFSDWCAEYGLNLVFNLHKAVGNYCDIQEETSLLEDEGLQRRFIALWLEIERRFQSKPEIVFELLNEVRDVPPEQWNRLAVRTISALREVNPSRRIVIGPVCWNNPPALKDLVVLDDPNVIYTFHMYAPFEFTHQQGVLQANPLYYNRKMPYPCDDIERYRDYKRVAENESNPYQDRVAVDKEFLRKELQPVFDFMEKHTDKILWAGEFGTIRHAKMEWREAWMRDVISLYREHGIPYCVWNYLSTPNDGNRFSLVDDDSREILSPEMLKIIQGKTE